MKPITVIVATDNIMQDDFAPHGQLIISGITSKYGDSPLPVTRNFDHSKPPIGTAKLVFADHVLKAELSILDPFTLYRGDQPAEDKIEWHNDIPLHEQCRPKCPSYRGAIKTTGK